MTKSLFPGFIKSKYLIDSADSVGGDGGQVARSQSFLRNNLIGFYLLRVNFSAEWHSLATYYSRNFWYYSHESRRYTRVFSRMCFGLFLAIYYFELEKSRDIEEPWWPMIYFLITHLILMTAHLIRCSFLSENFLKWTLKMSQFGTKIFPGINKFNEVLLSRN